jgi:hypothetical protein
MLLIKISIFSIFVPFTIVRPFFVIYNFYFLQKIVGVTVCRYTKIIYGARCKVQVYIYFCDQF